MYALHTFKGLEQWEQSANGLLKLGTENDIRGRWHRSFYRGVLFNITLQTLYQICASNKGP